MTQTSSTGPQRPDASAADRGAGSAPSQGVGGQAQDKVEQLVDQAQQMAGQVTGQAKQQATSQVESQKDRAVDSLVTVTQALRQTSQHLHEQQQGPVAGYVDQVAERAEHLTNYLRARDVPQIVSDTEDLARRQPGLFVASALALGFAGARFLMASGRRERQLRRALPSPGMTAGHYQGYGTRPSAPSSAQTTARQAVVPATVGGLGGTGTSSGLGTATGGVGADRPSSMPPTPGSSGAATTAPADRMPRPAP